MADKTRPPLGVVQNELGRYNTVEEAMEDIAYLLPVMLLDRSPRYPPLGPTIAPRILSRMEMVLCHANSAAELEMNRLLLLSLLRKYSKAYQPLLDSLSMSQRVRVKNRYIGTAAFATIEGFLAEVPIHYD